MPGRSAPPNPTRYRDSSVARQAGCQSHDCAIVVVAPLCLPRRSPCRRVGALLLFITRRPAFAKATARQAERRGYKKENSAGRPCRLGPRLRKPGGVPPQIRTGWSGQILRGSKMADTSSGKEWVSPSSSRSASSAASSSLSSSLPGEDTTAGKSFSCSLS